jgi:hypothetical protein
MLKKLAADALGLSDIGVVIRPQDYDKVDSDDYVMHEDGERIFFLIKSRADEYCFTNKALIHVDGTSAVSKKRTLRRLDYHLHTISDVTLETAGTLDRDVEIKFSMGGNYYSIDVSKNNMEELKDLYKALIKIGAVQVEYEHLYQYAANGLGTAAAAVNRSTNTDTLEAQFKAITLYSFNWMKNARESYVPKDFTWVFELFIKN